MRGTLSEISLFPGCFTNLQSMMQARASNFGTRVDVFQNLQQRAIKLKPRRALPAPSTPAPSKMYCRPPTLVGLRSRRSVTSPPSANNRLVTSTLEYFKKAVPEQSMTHLQVQQLMLHAIAQTAIATFSTTSLEIFAQDGYMIDECGQIRAKTFVYSENLRYRIRHHTSSFRTALGCVWIRTTTMYFASDSEKTAEKSQTVTSFIFYPTKGLQLMGVRNGLEAIVASAGRSWLFNCRLTVTRAVAEDSLIFDLCRTGQTQAVQTLLAKGLGSVVDTSPKGWKPLHVRLHLPQLESLH